MTAGSEADSESDARRAVCEMRGGNEKQVCNMGVLFRAGYRGYDAHAPPDVFVAPSCRSTSCKHSGQWRASVARTPPDLAQGRLRIWFMTLLRTACKELSKLQERLPSMRAALFRAQHRDKRQTLTHSEFWVSQPQFASFKCLKLTNSRHLSPVTATGLLHRSRSLCHLLIFGTMQYARLGASNGWRSKVSLVPQGYKRGGIVLHVGCKMVVSRSGRSSSTYLSIVGLSF
jgi:hypothetical protein